MQQDTHISFDFPCLVDKNTLQTLRPIGDKLEDINMTSSWLFTQTFASFLRALRATYPIIQPLSQVVQRSPPNEK